MTPKIVAVEDVADARCEEVNTFTVSALLSFLAHHDLSSAMTGVEDLVGEYQQRYGTTYPNAPALREPAGKPIDYQPMLPVTYWGFRIMIGFGALSAGTGVLALWVTRRRTGARRLEWWGGAAFPADAGSVIGLLGVGTPFIANSAGWIFTEMGRQPFVVVPNPSGVDGVWMFTAQAVSRISVGEVLASLISRTAVYAVLGVVEFYLLRRYIAGGIDGVMPRDSAQDGKSDETVAFAY